jgi:hypothetical protein
MPRRVRSSVSGRRCILPGDDIVSRPSYVATHAITIQAPPEAVWPWLVQMGWDRAGWYTPHWVDRLLFPANRPSARQIIADLQGLCVGDFVPDAWWLVGGCWAVVAPVDLMMSRAMLRGIRSRVMHR